MLADIIRLSCVQRRVKPRETLAQKEHNYNFGAESSQRQYEKKNASKTMAKS